MFTFNLIRPLQHIDGAVHFGVSQAVSTFTGLQPTLNENKIKPKATTKMRYIVYSNENYHNLSINLINKLRMLR